jgi:hypothetical protein
MTSQPITGRTWPADRRDRLRAAKPAPAFTYVPEDPPVLVRAMPAFSPALESASRPTFRRSRSPPPHPLSRRGKAWAHGWELECLPILMRCARCRGPRSSRLGPRRHINPSVGRLALQLCLPSCACRCSRGISCSDRRALSMAGPPLFSLLPPRFPQFVHPADVVLSPRPAPACPLMSASRTTPKSLHKAIKPPSRGMSHG